MSTLSSISRTDKNPNFNGYGPEGQGFESLTACQEKGSPIGTTLFLICCENSNPLTAKREAFFERSGWSCEAGCASNRLAGVRIPYGVPKETGPLSWVCFFLCSFQRDSQIETSVSIWRGRSGARIQSRRAPRARLRRGASPI